MSDDVKNSHEQNEYPFNEIQRLCDEFDIGALKAIQKKLGGHFNLNLKVETAKGNYVIRKMSPSASISQILYVQDIISTLCSRGVPAIQPLTNQNGKIYAEWDGSLVQVSPFIKAITFSNSVKQVYMSGVMLRSFHNALVEKKPGPPLNWSLYPSETFLSSCIRKLDEMPEISKVTKKRIVDLHDRVMGGGNCESKPNGLPETVIHGDWHFWNLLYKNDKVSCVMDFDFVQRAERIFDIAYTLWGIHHFFSGTYHYSFSNSFLEGYGELTSKEKQKLPQELAKISLFFICAAVHSRSNEEKLKKKLAVNEDFIKWVLSNNGLNTIQSYCT